MGFTAPPRELVAEPFARLPDALRRPGRRSAWADANKGAPLDCFLEGPVSDGAGGLWCCDIPFGRILHVDAAGTFTVVAEYDGEPNGLALGPDGRMWIADYRQGILALDLSTGAVEPVLERRRAERFKGPNDLCFSAAGDLFFTDQGQTGLHDPTGRVYRLSADGRLECLIANGPSPNGVALDPSGTALFVAMTRANQIWRLPLLPEGGTTKVHAFVTLSGGTSGPDGLAVDADGNLCIAHASRGTVWQVDRHGEPRLRIRSGAGMNTTNCCFGGADMRDLFVVDSETGTILRARLDRPGLRLPFGRD